MTCVLLVASKVFAIFLPFANARRAPLRARFGRRPAKTFGGLHLGPTPEVFRGVSGGPCRLSQFQSGRLASPLFSMNLACRPFSSSGATPEAVAGVGGSSFLPSQSHAAKLHEVIGLWACGGAIVEAEGRDVNED